MNGQPVKLLATLVEHSGETVTRDELQKRLWMAETYVDFEHSLNAAIKRLRRALGDSAGAPRFIETIAGQGYRFIAPLNYSVNTSPMVTQLLESQVTSALPQATAGHRKRVVGGVLSCWWRQQPCWRLAQASGFKPPSTSGAAHFRSAI